MKTLQKSLFVIVILLTLLSSHLQVYGQNESSFEIRSIRWSPDGSKIAVARIGHCDLSDSQSFPIQIIDSSTLETVLSLPGDNCSATSVDWSPHGDKLVSVPFDGFGQIWDMTTGKVLVTTTRPGQGFLSSVWSNQGNRIASTFGSNGVTIWDSTTGQGAGLQSIGGTVIDWSPDDAQLVTGSGYDSSIDIWDSLTGKEQRTLVGHTDGIVAIDWSLDGSKIASASLDNTVRLWDAISGKLLFTLDAPNITQVRWSPDTKKLITTNTDGDVQVWDTTLGQLLNRFAYGGVVWTVDWSPDGTKLAYGGEGVDGKPAEVQIVTVPRGTPVTGVRSIAWSPDGKQIAIGGGNAPQCSGSLPLFAIYILDAVTQKTIKTLEGHTCIVWTVAWSPDGTKLASGSTDGTAIVWDLKSGKIISQIKHFNLWDGRSGEVWSSDGSKIADMIMGSDLVTIWNPSNGEVLNEFEVRSSVRSKVNSISWNPDGKRLAIADIDGLQIISLTGEVITDLSDGKGTAAVSVGWSPDGQFVAASFVDKTISIWNASTYKLVKKLAGHTDYVSVLKWSPDSTRLASGGKDDTLRIWDIGTGQQIDVIKIVQPIRDIAWNPNSGQLIYVDWGSNQLHMVTPAK